jgi:hypothetical protein
MFQSTRFFRRWSLALLLSAFALQASGQEEGGVRVRFVSFPKSAEPLELEMRVGEEKTVEIKAPSNEVSKPIRVPALSEWVFGETVLGQDDKPIFKVLGKGKAVSSPDQIILLVQKGKDRADGYEVLTVDGRAKGFGVGKFLFLNAAQVKIAGDIGSRKFVLIPGAYRVIEPKNTGGLCQATLFYDKDGEARPFYDSRWPVSANARAMIFIYHDPTTKKLKLHSLRDFIE